MKSIVLKGKPWIYIYYAIIRLICFIWWMFQGEIELSILSLLVLLFLLCLYIIKKKFYVKLLNDSICINMQKKWHSFKMNSININISNIDSIEVSSTSSRRMWFWIIQVISSYYNNANKDYHNCLKTFETILGKGFDDKCSLLSSMIDIDVIKKGAFIFAILALPLIVWRAHHKKIIIHQKSGKILHFRVTPLQWNDAIAASIEQYTKTYNIKMIISGKDGQSVNSYNNEKVKPLHETIKSNNDKLEEISKYIENIKNTKSKDKKDI